MSNTTTVGTLPMLLFRPRQRRRIVTRARELGALGGFAYRSRARGVPGLALTGGFLLLSPDRAWVLQATRTWGDPGPVIREIPNYEYQGSLHDGRLLDEQKDLVLALSVPREWRQDAVSVLRRAVGPD